MEEKKRINQNCRNIGLKFRDRNRHCLCNYRLKNEGLEQKLSNYRLTNEGLEQTLSNYRLKNHGLEPTLPSDGLNNEDGNRHCRFCRVSFR
jgi:hypothetical protein